MCGRFALKQAHLAQIARAAAAIIAEGALPGSRHNIAPGGPIPVIRNRPGRPPRPARQAGAHANACDGAPAGAALGPDEIGERELTMLHWGITPAWAGPGARPLANARAESVADKPSFREAFRRRRCLIPVTAFYEWDSARGTRRPWAFLGSDGEPFCLGGLWDDGQCAVVTTAANAVMAPVHHRMPVLLGAPDEFAAWLDPRSENPMTSPALARLLRPAPAERLAARPVSGRVNSTRHDDEDCLVESAHAAEENAGDAQLGFGW